MTGTGVLVLHLYLASALSVEPEANVPRFLSVTDASRAKLESLVGLFLNP
jgi:hypothetical protein